MKAIKVLSVVPEIASNGSNYNMVTFLMDGVRQVINDFDNTPFGIGKLYEVELYQNQKGYWNFHTILEADDDAVIEPERYPPAADATTERIIRGNALNAAAAALGPAFARAESTESNFNAEKVAERIISVAVRMVPFLRDGKTDSNA